MKMYEKVAWQYLKESGTVDPPPKMYQKGKEFILQRFSRHILAKAKKRIRGIKADLKNMKMPVGLRLIFTKAYKRNS